MVITSEKRDSAPSVNQITLPAGARALAGLAQIDYEDAFRVRTSPSVDLTARQWARATIADAPLTLRAQLVCGWTALGLKLGAPWSDRGVLGWTIQDESPDALRLAAGSRLGLGLAGELLFLREPGGLLFSTLVRTGNPATRRVWTRIVPFHRHTVRSLLMHAAQRESARRGP